MDSRKIKQITKVVFVFLLFLSSSSLSAQIKELNKKQFLEKVWNYEVDNKAITLKTDLPVVLDFHATWCGPCKMLKPELIALQKEYKGKILIYQIDVDKDKDLAAFFNVQAMPTLYFLPKEGKGTFIQGYRTKDELAKVVDVYLQPKK